MRSAARPQRQLRAAQRRVGAAGRVPRAGRQGRHHRGRRHRAALAVDRAAQPARDPAALHGQGAVPPTHGAVAAGRLRPRRLPLPVLRAAPPTRSTTCCRARAAASTSGRTSPPRAVRATWPSATARPTRPACAWPARAGRRGRRRGSSSAWPASRRRGSRTSPSPRDPAVAAHDPAVSRIGGTFHALTLADDPARRGVGVRRRAAGARARLDAAVDEVVDVEACAPAGVEVVRRRSGGGAVLLEPGAVVWFDVVVPAAQLRDEGVGDDVARVDDLARRARRRRARRARRRRRRRSTVAAWPPARRGARWCASPGSAPARCCVDGVKLVGISQRRTRAGARFQCAVHSRGRRTALAGAARRRSSQRWPRPVATLPRTRRSPCRDAVAAALPPRLSGEGA